MKITAISYSGKKHEVDIADAIEGSVEDSLSEGTVEEIKGKVDNLAKLVGNLVEALWINHKLTDKQLKSMLSWRYTIEE